MKRSSSLIFYFLLLLAFTSCVEEKLAFTVDASPVLGLIDLAPAEEGMVAYTATFYELDKTGILDQNVGIDSIPLAGLELRVESQERALLQTVMTDAAGIATFEMAANELDGVSRLEWAGTFNGQVFRILKNR